MKYVRTTSNEIYLKKGYERYSMICGDVLIGAIIKESDTIEDLVDMYVVEDGDEYAIFYNLSLAKGTKGTVYGAIKTKKGLNYVARLNDKGEFELL